MQSPRPAGIVLYQLQPDAPHELLARVRMFCLRMIKEVYGYDYRADWHADLDTLVNPAQSPYFLSQGGAFFVLQNQKGDIVGTAGLRSLLTRPDIIQKSQGRYADPRRVGSHWRMYIDSRYRKQGLGQHLINLRRQVGAQMGYQTIYFHCSKSAYQLRKYWETQGFSCFMEDDMSAHYDGPISSLLPSQFTEGHNVEQRVTQFWQNLTALTAHLNEWKADHPEKVPSHLCHHCQSLCQLLKAQDAQLVCADPRNASKVRAVRDAYADVWSSIYSRLEFQVAQEIWPQVSKYQDFKKQTNAHPLFLNADDVAQAEIDLLITHGVSLSQAKVCMVGPGAIPNTALAFAHQGAHMTMIDCYQPACEWVGRWFSKLFPQHAHRVISGLAEDQDYSQYDVVLVAAMLYNRPQVIQAIEATRPRYVLLRTTANRRPMSMLMPQTTESDLHHFIQAKYLAETNPPLQVGNFSLLYQY